MAITNHSLLSNELLRNKLKKNLNQIKKVFIQENIFENVV